MKFLIISLTFVSIGLIVMLILLWSKVSMLSSNQQLSSRLSSQNTPPKPSRIRPSTPTPSAISPAKPLTLETSIKQATISALSWPYWELIVAGDVNLGRSVNSLAVKTNNFDFALNKISSLLKNANLSLINFEGTIIPNCPLTDQGMNFCTQTKHLMTLQSSGIDVVSLANNHSEDFGQLGFESTTYEFESQNILVTSHLKPITVELHSIKLAIIGIDTTIKPVDESELIEILRQVRSNHNLVIPYFHWGQEYKRLPSDYQRHLAQLCADNGADLILGSHPHWVQAMEFIRKGENQIPVIYSHGNAVFDQLWSEETREGILGVYKFYGSKLVDIGLIPLFINSSYQPEVADPSRSQAILSKMRKSSQELTKL